MENFKYRYEINVICQNEYSNKIFITYDEKFDLYIESYKIIKKELSKYMDNVIFDKIYDIILTNPILAWSKTHEMLEPVKEHVKSCKQFLNQVACHNYYSHKKILDIKYIKKYTDRIVTTETFIEI